MIKLNKNIEIGMRVTIPKYLSWQTIKEKIDGEYVVVEIVSDCWSETDEDHFYRDKVKLKRNVDGFILWLSPRCLSYFVGEDVECAPLWEKINPDEYQPSLSELVDYRIFTEDNMEFGFWYIGYGRSNRPTLPGSLSLSSDMINREWCYGKLPWDKKE